MKDLKKTIINYTEKICKSILVKIDSYKEKEQWRELASCLKDVRQKDCSDAHALDFCIQEINGLVEEFSLKDFPGSKIIVINGLPFAEFCKQNYQNFGENHIKDIANSIIILCQKEETQTPLLRIRCTEEGMKSLSEFFQGKGFVNINI